MRVLGIILFEFILGYVMQAFTLVLGLNVFNKRKIEIKKYVITGVILTAVIYVTRFLPIDYGVNTIVNIAVAFLLGLFFLKLPAVMTGIAVIALTIMLFTTELVYSYTIISFIGQDKFEIFMKDSLDRYLVGFPPTVLFTAIISFAYYFFVIKKRKISEIKRVGCSDENF